MDDNKKKKEKEILIEEKELNEEIKEEIVEEEPIKKDNKKNNDEFFKSKKDKKSLFNRIMNIVLWFVLFIWMGICVIDFYNSRTKRDAVFCLNRETTVYTDGVVKSCTGLGYKVINYERTSFNGIEFGPFWAKDRTAE